MAPKNTLGPSFFTPLVSGVVSGVVSGMVQVSEHEVRKPVTLRSLHAEKEGEELFCWNKGGYSYVGSMRILLGKLEFTVKKYNSLISCLSLCLCNLFSGGGHDTMLSQIACKKARMWTFFWLDRNQYGWFAPFRLAKMPPSVSCCWFQSAFFLASRTVNTHARS